MTAIPFCATRDDALRIRDEVLPQFLTIKEAVVVLGCHSGTLRNTFARYGLGNPSDYLRGRDLAAQASSRAAAQMQTVGDHSRDSARDDEGDDFAAWAELVAEPSWVTDVRRSVAWMAEGNGHIPSAALLARIRDRGGPTLTDDSLRRACAEMGVDSPW